MESLSNVFYNVLPRIAEIPTLKLLVLVDGDQAKRYAENLNWIFNEDKNLWRYVQVISLFKGNTNYRGVLISNETINWSTVVDVSSTKSQAVDYATNFSLTGFLKEWEIKRRTRLNIAVLSDDRFVETLIDIFSITSFEVKQINQMLEDISFYIINFIANYLNIRLVPSLQNIANYIKEKAYSLSPNCVCRIDEDQEISTCLRRISTRPNRVTKCPNRKATSLPPINDKPLCDTCENLPDEIYNILPVTARGKIGSRFITQEIERYRYDKASEIEAYFVTRKLGDLSGIAPNVPIKLVNPTVPIAPPTVPIKLIDSTIPIIPTNTNTKLINPIISSFIPSVTITPKFSIPIMPSVLINSVSSDKNIKSDLNLVKPLPPNLKGDIIFFNISWKVLDPQKDDEMIAYYSDRSIMGQVINKIINNPKFEQLYRDLGSSSEEYKISYSYLQNSEYNELIINLQGFLGTSNIKSTLLHPISQMIFSISGDEQNVWYESTEFRFERLMTYSDDLYRRLFYRASFYNINNFAKNRKINLREFLSWLNRGLEDRRNIINAIRIWSRGITFHSKDEYYIIENMKI